MTDACAFSRGRILVEKRRALYEGSIRGGRPWWPGGATTTGEDGPRCRPEACQGHGTDDTDATSRPRQSAGATAATFARAE